MLRGKDFAGVVWGGGAVAPGHRVGDVAVRVPVVVDDSEPWLVRSVERGVFRSSDAEMVLDGWSLPGVFWEDADVVEARTVRSSVRQKFLRVDGGDGVYSGVDGRLYADTDLVDPVALVIQRT